MHRPGRVNASFAWHVYPDTTRRYLCQFVTDVPKPAQTQLPRLSGTLLEEDAQRSHRKTQPVSWLRKIALGNSPSSSDTYILVAQDGDCG